jgi:hypothetical protein
MEELRQKEEQCTPERQLTDVLEAMQRTESGRQDPDTN